jgi:hypothetical protein
MLVFDVAAHLRRIYEVPALARAMRYPLNREEGDGDVWDGTLLKQWTEDMMLKIIPLAFSSDASVLQVWKQLSFTPCVGQLLSFPPHLRQSSLGYILMAVLPPKVKDFNALYGAMLNFQRIKGVFPELEEEADPCKDSVATSAEVTINDTSPMNGPPVVRKVRCCIHHIVEDSRGTRLSISVYYHLTVFITF